MKMYELLTENNSHCYQKLENLHIFYNYRSHSFPKNLISILKRTLFYTIYEKLVGFTYKL